MDFVANIFKEDKIRYFLVYSYSRKMKSYPSRSSLLKIEEFIPSKTLNIQIFSNHCSWNVYTIESG